MTFLRHAALIGQLYRSFACVFLIRLFRSTTWFICFIVFSDPYSDVLCSEECQTKYVMKCWLFSKPFSSSVPPKTVHIHFSKVTTVLTAEFNIPESKLKYTLSIDELRLFTSGVVASCVILSCLFVYKQNYPSGYIE